MTQSLERAVGSLTDLAEASAIISFMKAHDRDVPAVRGKDNNDPAEFRYGTKIGFTDASRRDAKRTYKEEGRDATLGAMPRMVLRA